MFDKKKSVFDTGNESGGQHALVKQVRDADASENQALAVQHAQVGKLAQVVASGADVRSDAQKLLYFLASYGEGDRIGKYAFSSGELVGLRATKRSSASVVGSGADARWVETMEEVPGVEASVRDLALTGPRLSDAANYLKSLGWAKLTHDGEFGIDCNFHEVSLTDAGRAAAQGAVKRAGSRAKDGGSVGFDDLSPFAPLDPPAPAAERCDRDTFTAMLSNARIKYSVEHLSGGGGGDAGASDNGGDEEEMTTVEVGKGKHRFEFTFDCNGKLTGCGGVSAEEVEK